MINTNETPATKTITTSTYVQGIILNTDPEQGCYSGDSSAPISGSLSSFALTMYTAGEKYLDTAAPYTSASILIADVTATIALGSNVASKMTDFTGQC